MQPPLQTWYGLVTGKVAQHSLEELPQSPRPLKESRSVWLGEMPCWDELTSSERSDSLRTWTTTASRSGLTVSGCLHVGLRSAGLPTQTPFYWCGERTVCSKSPNCSGRYSCLPPAARLTLDDTARPRPVSTLCTLSRLASLQLRRPILSAQHAACVAYSTIHPSPSLLYSSAVCSPYRHTSDTMSAPASSTTSAALQYKSPLLLGATGRVGGLILQDALAQQLHVTALVRDASKLAPRPNLRIVEGSPLVAQDVKNAMEGCDSVISALANARTSDMPWARQVSPDFFMRDSTRNIVQAMRDHSLRRLLIVSSWGVAEDFPNTPWLFRFIVHYSTMYHAFEDHGAVDADVKQSGLDWTLLRPVGFKGGEADGWRVVTHDNSTRVGLSQGMINRAVVARFALQALNNAALVQRTPVMTQEKAQ